MKSILVTMVALLASCAGTSTAARQEALVPAVVLAWGDSEYGVKSDTLRGIDDAVEDGDLADASAMIGFVGQVEAALSASNVDMISLSPWSALKGYAERGIDDRIDDGELVEATAVFLRRRLVNFDEAMTLLSQDGPWPVASVRTNLRSRVATPQGKLPLVAVVQN